jgi:Zn-dependent alcohol dehydrogenase
VGVNSGELRFVPVCEGECKSCLSGDRSRCTSCYSRELTGNYVYDAS